ncbi:MAG: prolipoprotein diacylglyceryl transferase [Candidatus Fischerbacteria bacterium RBG_13_37_8]|uniref:Phosphatidylglycerol--prolipoprotein diacylglyceryl transferase n=1 Tax=Candidatus Fischerbacteria bacterium RBG_13_37_8 TaxID=1817863 RepID=A0A1F5V5L8_9BACT|nr:MAG: prolipoprotein diacylglyceryl transferase [Candidatus Fischerbacteria bacterium RBG_13_37_8]
MFGSHFGTLTIHTYGVILAIAFFLGFALFFRYAKKGGIPEKNIYDLFFYIVISALAGSKIFHLLIEWRYYLHNPGEILFAIARLGGVFYGGLILALIVSIIYLKYHKLPVWGISDYAAPGIALGLAIGRWGCFAAGCCYGSYCTLPWAVVYTDQYAFETVGTPIGVPLHPAPIYESVAVFLIFIVLVFIMIKREFDGQAVSILLVLMGTERFFVEFLRSDERGFVFNNSISTSQLLSIIIVPAGICLYFFLSRKQAK